MKIKPSPDDLRLAAECLNAYEGENDTTNQALHAMQRVQDWLYEQADAADFRNACKEEGVPVALVRKALRQRGA